MITPEMDLAFESRTREHCNRVIEWLDRIAMIHPDYATLLKFLGDRHDASKFESPERRPYVYLTFKYLNPKYEYPDGVCERGRFATGHHIKNNKHHPEYWDPMFDLDRHLAQDRDDIPSHPVDGRKMPDVYILEMCADWCAMSEELGNTPMDWAERNIGKRWLFDDRQEKLIFHTLRVAWEGKYPDDEKD